MYYELALISVVVAGTYWGWYFITKQPHGTATFGIMQLTAALLCGVGLYAHRYDGARWMGVAGAIGVGAGTCLLVIGPLVRALARWFASAERLGIAGRLLDIADLLAPGSGVADEKALIGAMKEIRDGHIEQTVDALTAAKDRAPADARLAIDERIAMLYLAAYRWSEAITYAEEHLFGAIPSEPPPQPVPLRRALGFAPPVWVELLGAYGRIGDLDRAAQMLSRLEDVCEGRDDAGVWLHRARLMFLALAGRPAAVKALLEPRRARHMSVAARTYWLAVAHEHEGNRVAATAAYEKARSRSRGRPRELIDRALENLAKADGLPAVKLSDEANEVVARVEAAPAPSTIASPTAARPWATYGLTAALLIVSGTISLFVGSTRDIGVVMRAGALMQGLVDEGEWWRVFSCIFVHVGFLHLLVNVVGTWFVGRIAEELFGTSRTLAIFIVAGFAGSVASYLSSAGVSTGASGALFGLLGAVFVELTWHRPRYRAAWKRGMWSGLAIVIVAQIGYGFFYPIVDQWAHGAGLVAGTVLGALLSPHAPWVRAGRHIGRVIAVAAVAVIAVAAVQVARTSIEGSLMRWSNGVQIAAPAPWITNVDLVEPDGLVILSAKRTVAHDAAAQIAMWVSDTQQALEKERFEKITPAPTRVVPLPEGWSGSEMIGSFADAMGYTQHYRVIACGLEAKGSLVLVVVMTPDSIAHAAPGYFTRLLGSMRLH